MKTKKIIAVFLSASMLLSLAACSKGNSSSISTAKTATTTAIAKKKLVAWAWDKTFNIPALNEAKALYQKDHPDVEIDIVEMAQADIVQKLNTSLSANSKEGLPNIVLIEDMRSQNFLTAYGDGFKAVSDKVQSSNFMDYKAQACSKDGKLYGVPFDSGVTGLFYRTDLIEQAGYKKEDMNNLTWDKYIQIGKAVKAKTGKAMLTLDPSDIGLIRVMMQSAGSWYYKADGKTIDIADNQALKESIKTWKGLVDAGIVKPITGWDNFTSAPNKGDVATVPTGCWFSSPIMSAKDQSGKWAIAQIPRLAGVSTSVNASNLGGSSWYVLNNVGDAATLDAAVDFLSKTFGSSTELMNTLMSKISLVSSLKGATSAPNYNLGVNFYGGQKLSQDFGAWALKVPAVNYGSNAYAIEDVLAGAVQNIVTKKANIDSTLKDVQQQAEAAVTK